MLDLEAESEGESCVGDFILIKSIQQKLHFGFYKFCNGMRKEQVLRKMDFLFTEIIQRVSDTNFINFLVMDHLILVTFMSRARQLKRCNSSGEA